MKNLYSRVLPIRTSFLFFLIIRFSKKLIYTYILKISYPLMGRWCIRVFILGIYYLVYTIDFKVAPTPDEYDCV